MRIKPPEERLRKLQMEYNLDENITSRIAYLEDTINIKRILKDIIVASELYGIGHNNTTDKLKELNENGHIDAIAESTFDWLFTWENILNMLDKNL